MSDKPDQSKPLALVVALLGALDDEEIRYCHWKSNHAIAESLSGDGDLDLLISRRDGPRFGAALSRLGFRVARPPAEREVPGLVDYLGFDDESGRWVHVQAHHQLVLGDDMTKNFRLPFEEAYLEARRFEGLVAISSPDFELLVFVLRMVVKHCPLDAQISHKGRLTGSERQELAHLLDRADPATVEELRARHTPFVSARLFEQCLAAIAPDAGRLTRAVAGSRLLRSLAPVRRRSSRADLGLRLWRRWRRRSQRGKPPDRRHLDAGGLLVGVVGGDGSGKSSAVAALDATFTHHLPTQVHHLGKPPPSFLTALVRRPIRRLPDVGGRSLTSLPAWTRFDGSGPSGPAFVLWHTLIARDRFREYQTARRAAARGSLVICDRFPLPAITLMDGPRAHCWSGLDRRRLARWLAAREAAYYRRIGQPDLLVVMRAHPDVAVSRRGEQDADFVRRRAEEVWTGDWSRYPAVVVDASQPHEAVLAEVHAAIWQAL